MALPRKTKFLLALIPFALLLVVGLWQGGKYWWYRGYSKGTRTGVIRKLSVKGPPYCKYLAGELILQGTTPGLAMEVFEFSVDDDSDANPLVKQLHEAEKQGTRVTVKYRQDVGALYRCTPNEYFVVDIEK